MVKKKIVLIGGGGHCKVVISILKELDNFEIAGIVDNYKTKTLISGIKIIGTDDDLKDIYKSGIHYALITVGSIEDNTKRYKLFNMAKDVGYKFPVIISPEAIVDESVKIGEGTVIMPGSIINIDSSIGKNCIINTGVIIEHDCKIGNHCHIAPGVHISGEANIGELSFIGIGAIIIQGIKIGKNVTIGAGSVVIKDIPDNVIAVGNPAKIIKIKNKENILEMIKNNNIFIFTSTRADYGLQRWIIKEIQNNNKINTYVVVGGTHLSEEYGNTIEEILKDNIENIIKVPFLNTSLDASSLTSLIGNGLIQITQIFNTYKPDFIILLGDRYELFIMAITALLYQVPIIHLHGGENTTGVIDEQVRHAITKMAHIHIPSTSLYAENISKMGEEDWRIYIIGAPGLENIKKLELYTKEKILKLTGIDVNKNTIICTYHPVTLEGEDSVKWQIKNLLEVLSKFDFQIVFTRPNAEVGSDEIINMIKEFVGNNLKAYFFDSLGSKLYLSFLNYAKAVVGNSSSGIIEVPSFLIPTVNIGNRQEGRLQPESVIQTGYSVNEICKGIEKALYDIDFLKKIKTIKNPYGDGNASKYVIKAMKEILKVPKEKLLKKKLDFEVKKNEWHRYV